MVIRRKWKKQNLSKDLPQINIIFHKYKAKDKFFNPKSYLDRDHKKYFETLMGWKILNEKKLLEVYPKLRFEEKRHIKIKGKPIRL